MPDHATEARSAAQSPAPLSRRAVIVGAGATAVGAGLLAAGCATDAGQAPRPSGTALGPASAVPVGGGAIFADQGVVVTQPAEGEYAAFSTVCPHQGCAVAEITDGRIVCPCHGSTFDLSGRVVAGPAPTGLDTVPVTVADDRIVLG